LPVGVRPPEIVGRACDDLAMRLRIEGTELPGRACAPADAPQAYDNIHVGVQRLKEVVELVPGDAATAGWEFDVTVRTAADGALDFAGPYVHGKKGDRFLYLAWGAVHGERFGMFRRAKLHFADIDPQLLHAAVDGDRPLVGRIRLTDVKGDPVCAHVRASHLSWELG
jgi:hypothetical protein